MDAQLDFGEVQPTAMLGDVMEFKVLQQSAHGDRLESLVERSGGLGVKIVLRQRDLLGLFKMILYQGLQPLGVIHARPAACPDNDLPPAVAAERTA